MPERMICHYRVVRPLGHGGMGEVLLAEDTTLERAVAIKLMCPELAKDSTQRKRFRTEARAASGLSHPNICVIYEVGETDDARPFLAMEYIEGQTLDALMRTRRAATREVLDIGIQVAEALEAAHARRIVHRDIKPGNIMLDRRGAVKVLDFGLAKRFAKDGLSDTTALSASLTQTGSLIGTPSYMSPEQVLGREVDHRSDIFSLGVVLYELVAGQKPFLGRTIGETINSVLNRRPEALGIGDPFFGQALASIIFKCLDKDAAQRYASARQLAADLIRLKSKSEHALTANAREETASATVPFVPPRAERTKLWQLAGKSVRPANSLAAPIFALAAILAAAAFLFYVVDSAGGRLAIAIGVGAIEAAFAYWWFSGRTRSAMLDRQRSGLNLPSQAPLPPSPTGNGTQPGQQKSLAVLPFANFSAEKDSDYLSDGLTEEITSTLSRLAGLKVAARNSAFAFKGRHEDARKIGETLRVTMLLEGSVRKSGRQIRVTAQLVNVADGYHVWSETFDRDVGDVIAVQEEIARRIAERLRMEIGAETSAAMVQRRAVNPEAHVIYLQARHAWNKRTHADIEQAIQLFRKAIDIDPAFADAHAALGAAYVIMPGYAYRFAAEYLSLARGAAARALELDSTSAEAHAVIGDAAAQVGDFDNGLRHLRRAIELNPNYATGHHWYGAALMELGRMEEALAEFRKAEELDPLSAIIRVCIAEWYYFSGQNDEAIAESKKAIEIFPNFPPLGKFFALAYIRKGMCREARAEILRVRALTPDTPARLDLLALCEARLGNEAEARRILGELEDWQKRGHDMNEELGFAHLGIRQYDQAVAYFERFAVSGILCWGALRNPLLTDELRDHPRFQALMRRFEPHTAQLPDKSRLVGALAPTA